MCSRHSSWSWSLQRVQSAVGVSVFRSTGSGRVNSSLPPASRRGAQINSIHTCGSSPGRFDRQGVLVRVAMIVQPRPQLPVA